MDFLNRNFYFETKEVSGNYGQQACFFTKFLPVHVQNLELKGKKNCNPSQNR
jgi:hypothetical protein